MLDIRKYSHAAAEQDLVYVSVRTYIRTYKRMCVRKYFNFTNSKKLRYYIV